jgi:quercetin dioxygenase-like cupin family protein
MSQFFPTPTEMSRHTIFPGVHIHTAACERMMLSVVDLEPGAVVEEHAHPHEQVGILIQGRVEFTIGGETKTLQPGEMWRIPGGVRHKVRVLEGPAKALDIFTPIREDYL